VWAIGLKQNTITTANIFILPVLAVLFLSLTVLYWRQVIPCVYLNYCLWNGPGVRAVPICFDHYNDDLHQYFVQPHIYTLAAVCLHIELPDLENKPGPAAFSTLFPGNADPGDGFLHPFPGGGRNFPNISLLVQIYFAGGFYITVLYLVSHIKELYFSEHGLADDMSKLAMIDSLTQVDNRRLLTQLLTEEVTRAGRHNLPLSVILFDLDRFKTINILSGIMPEI